MPHRNGHKAQGFRPAPEDIAVLVFTDGRFEGAEVKCRLAVPMGVYLMLTEGAANIQAMADRLKAFGRDVLIEWNAVDGDGEPIPATSKGMLAIDEDFASAVLVAWRDAKIGIPDPLGPEPSNGSTSEAESIQRQEIQL